MEKQKMEMPDIKQVILVREDLHMSPGKAAAQVGHAAILFMVDAVKHALDSGYNMKLNQAELRWMFDNGPIPLQAGQAVAYGGMKKIDLAVEDLNELWVLYWAARDAGLKAFIVFDEGLNEITACSIGPDYSDKIDEITGELELYGKPEKVVEVSQPTKAVHGLDVEELFTEGGLFNVLFGTADKPCKPESYWRLPDEQGKVASKAAREYFMRHGTMHGYNKNRG